MSVSDKNTFSNEDTKTSVQQLGIRDKAFILTLAEGVLEAPRSLSVAFDDVSRTHRATHKGRWALSNALFSQLQRQPCALTQQFLLITADRVEGVRSQIGSSHFESDMSEFPLSWRRVWEFKEPEP